TNLMMVTGVLALDGRVDVKRLRTLLDRRLAPFGRFHQRVVRPRLRGNLPHWQDDTRFDIDNHVSHVALPDPGGEKALRDLVSELLSTPLDMSKPLWHVHLIDGYDGGSVVLARIHHSIADRTPPRHSKASSEGASGRRGRGRCRWMTSRPSAKLSA